MFILNSRAAAIAVRCYLILLFCLLYLLVNRFVWAEQEPGKAMSNVKHTQETTPLLNLEQAERLAALPLSCITTPLPYKSHLVIAKASDLQMPRVHHPAFYGCFDWHSAVHGHWSLVYLLKNFPNLSNKAAIVSAINKNLSPENIAVEMNYFSLNKYTESFERTYGWAWLLKLTEELYTWNTPDAKRWYQALLPLAQLISQKYQAYLPKLVYPIRVGEHSNTAFGLSFAYDYASTLNDASLKNMIEARAKDFYLNDKHCPLSWEPSGYDFLSPCLQELDIMRKVLPQKGFDTWAKSFLPELFSRNIMLEPAIIKDRSDGKLVHLDGLNFSRAWCLYSVNTPVAVKLANRHLHFSLANIVDGDYAGEHWLASFALYAFSKVPK